MTPRATLCAFLLTLSLTTAAYAGTPWSMRYDSATFDRMAPAPIAPWSGGGAVIAPDHEFIIVDSAGAVRVARHHDTPVWGLAQGANDTIFATEAVTDHLAIARLDAQLHLLWAWRFKSPTSGFRIDGLTGTTDGGVVGVGWLGKKALAIRLDKSGQPIWTKTLDLSGNEKLYDVIQTRDGSFVAIGSYDYGHWIAKLAGDGRVLWQKSGFMKGLQDVAEMPNGDIVAVGQTSIVRIGANGDVQWQKTSAAELASVAVGPSDTIIAAGLWQNRPVFLGLGGKGDVRWVRHSPLGGGGQRRLIASGDGWLFLRARPTKVVLDRIEGDGTGTCTSVAGPIELTPHQYPIESLPIEIESVVLTREPWKLALSDTTLKATAHACEGSQAPETAPPPPASSPAAASFDETAHIRRRAEEWNELVKAKNFARLDEIGEELQKVPWSSDPVHSDIDAFTTIASNPFQPEEQRLAFAREWIAKRPQSTLAHLELAIILNQAAGARRGIGYADTVTKSGWEGMRAFQEQARRALADTKGAERFPQYWCVRINLAYDLGGEDFRDVMRLSAKYTQDPIIYQVAMNYTFPKWGGSPAAMRSLAEEAAALTRTTWGDALYMWIAYQSFLHVAPDEYRAAAFEWKRVSQGCRDLIARAPKWLPTHHRYALLARRFHERTTARDLFRTPELNWYPGAERMWKSRALYDEAREWGLQTPDSPAVTPTPARSLKKPSTPMPAQGAPFLAKAPEQWPQLLMHNEATFAGVTYRHFASFLVETPGGVVAIGILPPYSTVIQATNWLEHLRPQLASWSMTSPKDPKRVFRVASIETKSASRSQQSVALALAPSKGNLPVPVLQLAPRKERRRDERVLVVACVWNADQCVQKVVHGFVLWSNPFGRGQMITFGLEERLSPESQAGAAVLDEAGRIIAIGVDTRSGYSAPDRKLYPLDTEEIACALP